jgi:alpha-D-xyloside xylohydrolase
MLTSMIATLASGAGDTTLTPWCANSMRVRVAPASLPPAAQAAQAALEASLKAKNMTDLAGAMLDGPAGCGRGTPLTTAGRGTPLTTTHGNLVASVDADTVSFKRADTGALLLSVRSTFDFNGAPEPSPAAEWASVPDKAITCSGDEYEGSLGSFDTGAACLAAAKGSGERINYALWRGDGGKGCYVCAVTARGDPDTWAWDAVPGATSFTGPPLPRQGAGYFSANLSVTAGDADEVVYGLGQGNWTNEGGCPAAGAAGARIVPLERNGQAVDLMQRKFHVSIPFVYSTGGYGFLFNMPGYGLVRIGPHGTGGAHWSASAALYLDFWVSAPPSGVGAAAASGPVYRQYADATGHAPPLREDAMIFWQSRNRYKSSAIALDVAERSAPRDRNLSGARVASMHCHAAHAVAQIQAARPARRRAGGRLQEPGARRRLRAQSVVLPVGARAGRRRPFQDQRNDRLLLLARGEELRVCRARGLHARFVSCVPASVARSSRPPRR